MTEPAAAVAKEIAATLATGGVDAVSIRDQPAASQRQSTGFLAIIQGLRGLGIVVGVRRLG